MKKMNMGKSAVILLAILAICLMTGTSFANLVTNGGFENSEPGATTFEGWSAFFDSGVDPAPEFTIVDDEVQEGSRAFKATINGVGSNAWDIQAVADSIPVTPGHTYNYSIWAKASGNGASANFTVGNYSYQEYASKYGISLTTEWKKITLQFTVNDDQTVARAPIHFSSAGNSGKDIYLDNLQISDVNFGKTPVVVEAEEGTLGSSLNIQEFTNISYIYPSVNFEGMASPNDTSRVATFQVTFEDSGYYHLFARMQVGANTFNDDSFFPANGFGVKDDTLNADWVLVNGLAGAGYTREDDVVNTLGAAGSQVWKWVNISNNFYPADTTNPAATAFYVSPDSLTQTFQIGSREDGLFLDKFAFGKANLYYTVNALDNGLPGSETVEPPDSSKFWQGPPLATGSDKFLGNASGSQADNVFANYWNQLTPGNAGKWESVGWVQDTTQWNWTNLDRAYNYAKDNDLLFKNHTLIWGNQQPNWISDLDSAEQYIYLETWIRQVGERYPDMDMIDVVNEPLINHNPPDGVNGRANYKQALGGNGETGWDWVIKSFELARQYMPNTELILNDYGIINDDGATSQYLGIINLLKNRGLIDAIGVQGHRFEFENTPTTTLTRNLDRLANTGLPIYISEFDLGNLGDSGTPDDNKQLELYQRIFPVVWEHPGVKGITLWGYLEGQMWQETCYLVHDDGTPRPAFNWLVEYMEDYISGVEQPQQALPLDFVLEQNYPNPFNPVTNIRFTIPGNAQTSLIVYDILGQQVATLVNSRLSAGAHSVTWDGKNNNGVQVVSGTYFCKLVSGEHEMTQKMLLLK